MSPKTVTRLIWAKIIIFLELKIRKEIEKTKLVLGRWCQPCPTLKILTCCVELASQWKMGPDIVRSHLSIDRCVTVTMPDTGFIFFIFLIFKSLFLFFSSTLSCHCFMWYEICLYFYYYFWISSWMLVQIGQHMYHDMNFEVKPKLVVSFEHTFLRNAL